MVYQVLARKWRPQNFTDLVGQDHILNILINSFKSKKIHHAYLLSGYHGVGKTTIARLIAKGLNCQTGITSQPCEKCKHCIEIRKNKFIDLIEIDAASRTKVEDTRDLLNNINYQPLYGRFKIYIIDEIHMLSLHSFNALLKTLEEPPNFIKFILVTTNIKKIPITIISRCLQLNFRILTICQIYKKLLYILKQEKIKIKNSIVKLLAKLANGSMRDALSLTDQVIVLQQNNNISYKYISTIFGIIQDSFLLEIVSCLINSNVKALFKKMKKYFSFHINWDYFLSEILSILHLIVIEQILPNQNKNILDTKFYKKIKLLSKKVSPTDIQAYYQIILIGRKELPYAPNQRIAVEITLLRVISFHLE